MFFARSSPTTATSCMIRSLDVTSLSTTHQRTRVGGGRPHHHVTKTERECEQTKSEQQPISRPVLHGGKETHQEPPFRSPTRQGGGWEWTDSGFRQSRVGGLIGLSARGAAVNRAGGR